MKLEDKKSKYGTYVNNTQLKPSEAVDLNIGNEIKFGKLQSVFTWVDSFGRLCSLRSLQLNVVTICKSDFKIPFYRQFREKNVIYVKNLE